MKNKILCFHCFLLFISLVFVYSDSVVAQKINLFRIGTGGKTGVYYPIGKIIAKGLTDFPADNLSHQDSNKIGLQGYVGVAQTSAGSIDNLESIVTRETEACFVQADIAAGAYSASGNFRGKTRFRKIRAIASLYPEYFQLVVRKDAGIRSVFDLKGKHISLDEQGSGTLEVMRILLDASGLSENDLHPVYLKPVFTHEKMLSNELQGFAMMAGTPMESVLNLQRIGVTLVPIDIKIANQVKKEFPFLVPGKIPKNTYPGVNETETLQVHALLVVSSEMEEDLVYRVTESLWSNYTLDLLHKGHLQGKSITPETALVGLSIPLHKGAERYYREHDLMNR